MDLQQKVTKWVENILKQHNYKINDVAFPNYDTDGGFAGDIIFVNVKTTKDNKEENLELLVKKSKDSEVVQKGINLELAYVNEVNFYSKFVPYFANFAEKRGTTKFENIPRCFGTLNENNQYVLVLQNLRNKGFKMNELKVTQDLNHVKLVIKAYAEWCALNLSLKDQEPQVFDEFGNCNESIVGTKLYDLLVGTFNKEIDLIIDLYGSKNETEIMEKLKKLKSNFERMFEDCYANRNENFSILRHGDCWNNNFLFQYTEESTIPKRVVIIDWQMSILGSPLADLTQFLFYCCSRSVLDNLDELLELYYATFSNKTKELGSDPEKCFPRRNFEESFSKYAPIAIAGMPIAVRLSCTTKNEKYEIEKADEEGDFSGVLEGTIEDPEGYYQRMTDILKFSVERKLI